MDNAARTFLAGKRKPVLHHRCMDIQHRAKQFAPFAALKGYEEAVDDTAYQCLIQTDVIYEECEDSV